MKRLALGVAALLVATAGSVATATPGSRSTGDWCEKNADAGARPDVAHNKPLAAGGGRRDSKVPNAFACFDASPAAADQQVQLGAVVNAWADHERGVLRTSCVPSGRSWLADYCTDTVTLPAKADMAPPSATVTAPAGGDPGRVGVDDPAGEPLVDVDVAGHRVSVDHGAVCLEVDSTPLCRENPGGR
ncbi:MAG TPA: hypothetical protein VHF47_10635 [Acidimicrobiales bacterium]|nr:hypothetical protein [Acidimicrobiales bacterium]